MASRTASRTADAVGGAPDHRTPVLQSRCAAGGRSKRLENSHAYRFVQPPPASAVREAVRLAIYREAYFQRHGTARTLGERLAQEGEVMRAAGCTSPTLDTEELAYTREIIRPYLEATDLPTAIVHLFGDPAAHSLGYRPVGLSRWAGLALALHDTLAARLSTLV